MAIIPPGNKQIGDYTNIVVTYKPCPVVSSYLMAGLVVTKKPVPEEVRNLLTVVFVVTKKPVPEEVRNLLTVGFVVTRKFTPSVETLILNLKYNTPGELTFT